MIRTYLFFIGFIFALAACQKSASDPSVTIAQNTIEIPKLLDRAEALRQGEEWDKVQNFYGTHSTALRKNPKDYDACLKLAECFIQEARVTGEHPHYYPAALKMVDLVVTGLENKPDISIKEKDILFQALSHKASVQLSLHDFANAKTTAQKAVAMNPYNAYIYGCLVDANVELGNYDEAVTVCDKMVSIRPDLRSYARVSYLREIYGDLPGAIEAMKMALAAGYPGYEQTEWSRLQLGHLYEKQKQWGMAQVQYETALEMRPNYPFAIAALAGLEQQQGHYKAALDQLNKAIAIIPEVGFYVEMAEIYKKTGDQAQLNALIPKIETMFQEDIAAGHNVALEAARFHLDISGNQEKARQFFNQEYTMRPNNKEIQALKARVEI